MDHLTLHKTELTFHTAIADVQVRIDVSRAPAGHLLQDRVVDRHAAYLLRATQSVHNTRDVIVASDVAVIGRRATVERHATEARRRDLDDLVMSAAGFKQLVLTEQRLCNQTF